MYNLPHAFGTPNTGPIVTPNKFTKLSAFRITRLPLRSTSLIQIVTGSLGELRCEQN
jgi:hypothetical protein